MKNKKNKKFKKDLYRYYGEKEGIKRRLLRPLEIKYIYNLRKASDTKNKFLKIYYKIKLHRLSIKTAIQIPERTKIGEGFYIGHMGRIIINGDSILGKNINIGTGVTIGQENRGKRKGCPEIGDNVWIGTNAVLVGNIKIGNNVLIAPNSYVNMDIPSNSIVIGNPAVIHQNKDATKGYINNVI